MPGTGPLIASGRTADVFDQGDGTVLRRYRIERDCSLEGRVMSWVASRGIPVPRVHHAVGPDLIMDRVAGPTMLEALQQRPWTLLQGAATLATLQRRLNSLAAPEWIPVRSGVPPGSSVLHLDLHPLNVILSPDGPVIIDWPNVSRGSDSFDASISAVIMSSFEAVGVRDRVAQKLLVGAFTRSRGRSLVRTSLMDACEYRLGDPNTTEGERSAIQRIMSGRWPDPRPEDRRT